MILDRRAFLEHSTSLSLTAFAWMAGLITPQMLRAAELEQAFAAKTAKQVIAVLADHFEIRPSENIHLKIPKVAENGAIVPLTITSSLDQIHSIAIVAEKNPIPLIGQFNFEKGTEPFIQARIKMAESSTVIVIANAGNHLFSKKKFVTVTVGGCGS